MIEQVTSRLHLLSGFAGVTIAGNNLPENTSTLILQIVLAVVTILSERHRRKAAKATKTNENQPPKN